MLTSYLGAKRPGFISKLEKTGMATLMQRTCVRRLKLPLTSLRIISQALRLVHLDLTMPQATRNDQTMVSLLRPCQNPGNIGITRAKVECGLGNSPVGSHNHFISMMIIPHPPGSSRAWH